MGCCEGMQRPDNLFNHLLFSFMHCASYRHLWEEYQPQQAALEDIYPTRKPEKVVPIGNLRLNVSQLQLCSLFVLPIVVDRSLDGGLE